MSQLALFDPGLVQPAQQPRVKPLPRTKRNETRASVEKVGAPWVVGMQVQLPITAGIEDERWRQYTIGLLGSVEAIEGRVAKVRIESPGHRFDGKLASVVIERHF